MVENMAEKGCLANLERLTRQLNEELKMAHELGLRVTLTPRSFAHQHKAAEELSVRVWRETELLRAPEPCRYNVRVFMESSGEGVDKRI